MADLPISNVLGSSSTIQNYVNNKSLLFKSAVAICPFSDDT